MSILQIPRRGLMGSAGGGMTPPVGAVAQFPVELTVTTEPTTMILDLSSVLSLLTSNRTYIYNLVLWRDNIVSSTTYTYVSHALSITGRVGTWSIDTNVNAEARAPSESMTSPFQLNVTSWVSAKSLGSDGKLTISMANVSNTDRIGDYKGLFTVLVPYTDEYTGTKLTTCPSGFISVT